MSKNIVVATSAVLLSVLLVTVLAGAERPAQPGMDPPHMEAFKRAWFEHQSGSVLARGTVVDSEGKALAGVKLTVREDRETRLNGRTKSVSLYSQLDTASFEAKAAGVSGLDLLFKAGKLYGKGRIAYLELRNDCVKAGLILRFDETGSRNLATEH